MMADTPKIRFKGYANAWEQRKLGDVAEFSKGNGYSKSDLVSLGAPIILYGRLYTKYETLIREIDTFVEPKEGSVYSKGGEVIIPASGETAEDIARAATVENAGVLLGGDLNVVTPDEDINSTFLSLSISHGEPQRELVKKAQGKSVVHIHNAEIKELNIYFPNEEEQEKIVSYFDTLDNLITLYQRKCEETKKLKKYMLQKMFPQNDKKIPEIRFAGFTEEWEQRKLGEVINVCSGMDYKGLGEGGIPVYGTGGYMLSVDRALSYDKDAIGIGRKGTIDKPYILKAPFWTVDTLFYCIPKDNINIDFMYSIFQNIDWKQKDESTGVPSLSKVIINSTKIMRPSLEEQIKIGEYFYAIDNLITLNQYKCDELKEVKKFMLQNMFPQKG
ncbi:MAG: restriction endonuclease subunit S [Butyrivibrio sp.]|nr:restriction endonuclease subunit S [Butyrivibrio sp.]